MEGVKGIQSRRFGATEQYRQFGASLVSALGEGGVVFML